MPGLTWDVIDHRGTTPVGARTVHRWTSRQVCRYLDDEVRPNLEDWSARDTCDRLRSAVIGVREGDVATLAPLLDLSIRLDLTYDDAGADTAEPPSLHRVVHHNTDQEAHRPCTH